MNFDFLISFLFVSCHFFLLLVHGAVESTCPKPKVRKQTIIKPKVSMNNSAKLLYMKEVQRAHQCYDLCCGERECNTAVMHYKQVDDENTGETIVTKQCFLFACGSPSVCSFDEHSKYAVIELPGKNVHSLIATEPPLILTEAPTTEKIETVTECPPGAPVAMCSDDVCLSKTCPAHPTATCKMNFCGGCNYDFFLAGKKVQCAVETNQLPPVASYQVAKAPTVKQETVVNTKAKVESNNEGTADIVHMESNEEAVMVSVEDVEEAPVETIPGEKPAKKEPTKDEEEDPYFQTERRVWLTPKSTEKETADDKAPEQAADIPRATVPSVIIRESTLFSVPLLVALIVCLLLLFVIVYRLKCTKRGKPKKFQVDDGDYLINGMYL